MREGAGKGNGRGKGKVKGGKEKKKMRNMSKEAQKKRVWRVEFTRKERRTT